MYQRQKSQEFFYPSSMAPKQVAKLFYIPKYGKGIEYTDANFLKPVFEALTRVIQPPAENISTRLREATKDQADHEIKFKFSS